MIQERKDVEFCKTLVKFSYDQDKIDDYVVDICKEVIKNNKIPGFRQGKATVDAVKIYAYKFIIEHLKEKLIHEAVQDIIFETKWDLLTSPLVVSIDTTYTSFVTEILFGYKPEVTLTAYKGLELEDVQVPLLEFYQDRIVDQLLQQSAETTPYTEDDFVLTGDSVVIAYKAYIGDQLVQDSNEGVVLEVGKTKTIPGFEDNLLGMRPGETKEFELEVTQQGAVKFVVELLSASKKVLPELNDEFVVSKGFESLEKFNTFVTEQATNAKNNDMFQASKENIAKLLLEGNELTLPEWAVLETVRNLCNQYGKKVDELSEEEKAQTHQTATNKVKLLLILDKIKKLEPETQLASEELNRLVELNLPNLSQEVQKLLVEKKDTNTYMQLMNEIQNEYIFRWVWLNRKQNEG